MLTAPRSRPQPRPPRSLRQEYSEFILQRIEEYKDQLSRNELLAIADEAVRELDEQQQEQLLLTEVLVLEHVDRLIRQRLNLPTYRRWRTRHLRLRRAQQQPTHWGLRSDAPVVGLVTQLDGEALVIGAAALPSAFFLLAHDWPVMFIASEVNVVEGAETRAAAESLGSRFRALVVHPGSWFPEVSPRLTVFDPHAFAEVEGADLGAFLRHLLERTPRGGVHCLMPPSPDGATRPLAPEQVRAAYGAWSVRDTDHGEPRRWTVAVKA